MDFETEASFRGTQDGVIGDTPCSDRYDGRQGENEPGERGTVKSAKDQLSRKVSFEKAVSFFPETNTAFMVLLHGY